MPVASTRATRVVPNAKNNGAHKAPNSADEMEQYHSGVRLAGANTSPGIG